MSKKRKITVVVIAGVIIFTALLGFIIQEREKPPLHGYKIPCETSPAFIASSGNWTGVLIDNDIKYTDGAHNIVPYDIDGDGKIELIANSYRSDALILYKNSGDPHKSSDWTRYVIEDSVGGNPTLKERVKKLLNRFTGGAHYTAIADINGDGRDDLVVAGDHERYDVVWYETPENITDISAWRKHVAYQNDSHRTYHVEAGDIDGDGDIDIVFTLKEDNSIGWVEFNGSPSNWPMTWIDTNCTRAFNARVADLDKDGKNDVIASEDCANNGGILHLYTYSDNPRYCENWVDHRIVNFPNGEGVSVFEIVDINRDGSLDIVTGNHQGDVYVLENPYPSNINQEWERYKVSNSYASRELDVGDIDSDGDLDIIVADLYQNQIVWFKNNGTTFYNNWERHIVDKSDKYLNWCHHVELLDIDKDGDLDIAVAAAGSNIFLCYYNDFVS